MKRIILIVGGVIFVAVAGRAIWTWQQMKVSEQQASTAVVLNNLSTEPDNQAKVETFQKNTSLCGKYQTNKTIRLLDDSFSSSYLPNLSGANFCSLGSIIRPINSHLYCKDSNCFYVWSCSNINSIKNREDFLESECQSDIFDKAKNPTGEAVPDIVTISSINNKNLKAGDIVSLHGYGFLPKDIWENSHNFDHAAVTFLKNEMPETGFIDEMNKRLIYTDSLDAVFSKNKSDTDFSFVLTDTMVAALKKTPSPGNKYKLAISFVGRDFGYTSNKIDFTLSSSDVHKPVATFKVDRPEVKSGERVGTTWTSSYVKSCSGMGVKTGGDLNGSYPSDPIFKDTVLGISCVGIDGSKVEATATVKVLGN